MKSYSEILQSEFNRVPNYTIKKATNDSGLSTGAFSDILAGLRRPTRKEHSKVIRAFPRMRHLASDDVLFAGENGKTSAPLTASIAERISDPAPASKPKKRIVDPGEARKNLVVVAPEPPRITIPPAEISSDPLRPSPLVVKTKTSEQFSAVETIDPDLAALLLEGNVRNRDISPALVEAMARDMREGRWQLTHQGIALDKECRLLDGQHRLSAVVLSGATVRMTVTYNVEPRAFNVVDLGGRPRSLGDVFGLKTGESYSSMIVASLRIMGSYGVDDNKSLLRRATPGEIDREYTKYKDDIHGAISLICVKNSIKKPWRTAPFVAGVAYAFPTDKEKISAFVSAIVSETSEKSKTMAALRRAFDRERDSNAPTRMGLSLLTLRALYNHVKGTETEKLYLTDDGGEGQEIPYRSFRAKRIKLGLAE